VFAEQVLILKSCAFHPNALVLKRREAASKDAPVRAGPGAAFWSTLETRDFASLLRMGGWVRHVSRRSL
jgi:hypothetical protein